MRLVNGTVNETFVHQRIQRVAVLTVRYFRVITLIQLHT